MIWLSLYAITVFGFSASLLGHPPILARGARQIWASLTNKASRGSRVTAAVPEPPMARTTPRRSPSWSQP